MVARVADRGGGGGADAIEAERKRFPRGFGFGGSYHPTPLEAQMFPPAPDPVERSSGCNGGPGPYQAPVFVTAPALQRTAPQVLRAALRPGHKRRAFRNPGPHRSATPARRPAIRPAADGTTGGILSARTTPLPRRPRSMARRPDSRSPTDAPRRPGPHR